MLLNEQRLTYLLEQYSQGLATPSETEELSGFIHKNGTREFFSDVLGRLMERYPASATEIASIDESNLLADKALSFDRNLPSTSVPVTRLLRVHSWWHVLSRYAAAAIIILGIGFYLWTVNKKDITPVISVNPKDIYPGRDGAILTLANGSQVLLDTIVDGTIALQGGAMAKVVNGGLIYEASGNEVVYNTMTTPKGRQYHITLPDGSEAWLNSASSIRYPTVFTGKERKIEIKGEAYFQVTRNAKMPFRVNINNKAEIEVLGTHFNVNAYENESTINTTLLEGSVRVIAFPATSSVPAVRPVMLKPGQQAQVQNRPAVITNNEIKIINNTVIDKVVAWKNGLFDFEGAGLRQVMQQLERWYDITVKYEGVEPDIEFHGKMYRDVPLSEVLKMLQKAGVLFKVEGRTIIIQ